MVSNLFLWQLEVVNQVTINRQRQQQGQQLQNHFLKATVATDQMDGVSFFFLETVTNNFHFYLFPVVLGGVENPLEDGTPAECDPNSEYWCCSGKKWYSEKKGKSCVWD